jgi:mannitol-1-phosphate 5-dehydrogenase
VTTFVGFGFGAIQAGLFARHAVTAFERVVIAYRRPEVIAAVREAGGYYGLNIASEDVVVQEQVGPVEMLNLYDPAEREQLIAALAEASEVVTALSSVDDYAASEPGSEPASELGSELASESIAEVLAQGLLRQLEHDPAMRKPCIFYAAENHHHAAERLQEAIWQALPSTATPEQRQQLHQQLHQQPQTRTAFLNTVIGKMSGIVPADGLTPIVAKDIVAKDERAFLVEAFDTILVSACPFTRRLDRLVEKSDLRPFEDAKLYGHNAIHALAAYVGQTLGLAHMYELREQAGLLPWLRAAFTEESGAALIRKHQGKDALFTPAGFDDYAEDLLKRMTQASLRDSCARVARDPVRKLAWDDRLIGTLRLAHNQGVKAERVAFGVWAALELAPVSLEQLAQHWPLAPTAERKAVLALLTDVRGRYQAWRTAGMPPLQPWWQTTQAVH